MVVKIPQHHHFSDSLTKKCVEETGWEISVPRKDDIAWSIVLFYLISTNYTNEDFKLRLKKLTGHDEIKSKCVKSANKAIQNYNPFKNRYSCFYDITLTWVVKEFQKNLNWSSLTKISDKLKAAAGLLSCQILYIQNGENQKIYSVSSKGNEASNSIITLMFSPIVDEMDINKGTVCSFILSTDFGSKLRIFALKYFLSEAELTKKNILKIKSLAHKDNFLISLLESNFRALVLDIYKSPYIVTKLSEATYKTDPRLTDNQGLSGLYYALLTGKSKILYKLYYFAANSCFETEGSFRSPDAHIVNNLYNLEKILSDDLLKSNNFDLCKKRVRIEKSFHELQMLNRFLLEINQKILDINEEKKYDDDVKDNMFEARKRKDTIVSILETYEKFFEAFKGENTKLSSLQDYVLHKNFYYLIDITMAIVFFEKIFHLKEKLSFKNDNIYSSIESSLFSLVLYRTIWAEIFRSWSKEKFKSRIDAFYAFLLSKRFEVYDEVTKFRACLQNTTVSEENVVGHLPKKETSAILSSSPVIKDFLEMIRLNYYLQTAQETKIEDIKSILAIERILQVIGEYMQPENYKNFSVRELLPLYLPPGNDRILRRLRNDLSHLKIHQFCSKIGVEKDYSFFQLIKEEISNIKRCFKPVFRVLLLQVSLYILKEFQETVACMQTSKEPNSYHAFNSYEDLLDVIKFLLSETLEEYLSDYKEALKHILNNLEEEINKEELCKKKTLEDIVNTFQKKIRPLICLTELLSYYDKDHHETLLKEIEHVRNKYNFASLPDAKKFFLNFLETYKNVLLHFFSPVKDKRRIGNLENIDKFLKILRDPYMSDEEKCRIREKIPPIAKESVAAKEIIKKSIVENDFSLSIQEQSVEFEKLCLNKNNLEQLYDCYESKSSAALKILELPSPMEELEEAFSENIIKNKKTYESLCEKMQFSEEIRNILGRLIPGQKQEAEKGNIEILLDRIELLRKILIEENKETSDLWTKIKSKKSKQYFAGKVVQRYLEERQLRASVEMLLFDCMMSVEEAEDDKKKCENGKADKEISEKESPENVKDEIDTVELWIKTSRLYSGVNLRNVISHGNPLLENLCLLLDPDDLPSAIIDKALRLIEKEDVLKEMLNCRKGTNCNRTVLKTLLFSTGNLDGFLAQFRGDYRIFFGPIALNTMA